MVAAPLSYSTPCPQAGMIHVPARMLTVLLEVLDTQRAVISGLKAERDAYTALRDNPNVTPVRKDILEIAYELMGCPLGTSPATRAYPDTIISHEKVAQRVGVCAKQVGKHFDDMVEQRWLKRFKATVSSEENGFPITHWHYSPVEGGEYLATVAAPGTLVQGNDPKTSNLAHDAEKAKEARAKLVEGCCPICKSTDCTIHCTNGHTTHMDDVEEARPSRPLTTTRRATAAPERAAATDENSVVEECSATQNSRVVQEECSAVNLPNEGMYSGEETSVTSDAPPVREESSATLHAAVATLAPATTRHPNAVRMLGQKGKKYLSIGRPLTEGDIAAHLLGKDTFGAGVLDETPDGPRVQALVWDEDGRFDRLIRAAGRLDRAGLRPVLVQNPTDPHRGHLWLLFNVPCAPAWAIAAAERIAPELRAVRERFPDLSEKGGARVRLFAGVYVTETGRRLPTKVAAGTKDGPRAWLDGTTPAAWALIGAAVSDPAILATTFVPREERPKLRPARNAPPVRRRPITSGQGAEFFTQFNVQNPIESMVDIDRRGFFKAPWRDERTASVHVYANGERWKDFGPDKRGGNAFDLWCALNGYWPSGADRPDRKAAYAALNPTPLRDGGLHIPDSTSTHDGGAL